MVWYSFFDTEHPSMIKAFHACIALWVVCSRDRPVFYIRVPVAKASKLKAETVRSYSTPVLARRAACPRDRMWHRYGPS